MPEEIGDSQTGKSNSQSDLLAQISFAVVSRSIYLDYTKKMDFADKRTRILTGELANHGEPYREHPRKPVEYTEAMDRAAA
jgi:hypothetical protein